MFVYNSMFMCVFVQWLISWSGMISCLTKSGNELSIKSNIFLPNLVSRRCLPMIGEIQSSGILDVINVNNNTMIEAIDNLKLWSTIRGVCFFPTWSADHKRLFLIWWRINTPYLSHTTFHSNFMNKIEMIIVKIDNLTSSKSQTQRISMTFLPFSIKTR